MFVLDDSCSAGQRIGSDQIFKNECADLSNRIDKDLPASTKVAVLLTSNPSQTSPLCPLEFITDKQAIEGRLAKLEPSDTRTDFAQSLAAAEGLLSVVKEGRRRIIVISDFRKVDFASREQQAALRKQFDQIAKGNIESSCLDYARECKKNLTMEKIELLDRSIIAGKSARIGLDMHNNGTTTVDNIKVLMDGRLVGEGRCFQRAEHHAGDADV